MFMEFFTNIEKIACVNTGYIYEFASVYMPISLFTCVFVSLFVCMSNYQLWEDTNRNSFSSPLALKTTWTTFWSFGCFKCKKFYSDCVSEVLILLLVRIVVLTYWILSKKVGKESFFFVQWPLETGLELPFKGVHSVHKSQIQREWVPNFRSPNLKGRVSFSFKPEARYSSHFGWADPSGDVMLTIQSSKSDSQVSGIGSCNWLEDKMMRHFNCKVM